jgi:hypothetical protein
MCPASGETDRFLRPHFWSPKISVSIISTYWWILSSSSGFNFFVHLCFPSQARASLYQLSGAEAENEVQ